MYVLILVQNNSAIVGAITGVALAVWRAAYIQRLFPLADCAKNYYWSSNFWPLQIFLPGYLIKVVIG
jgi:ABC-type lipoprotein release transport system permease subunit